MDSGTYIKRRVDALRDHSQEIYSQAEGVSNEFSSWTALKLILHSAAINMYTSVHQSEGTGDTFYIDALSGSGVSMYGTERYFVGSPLIAVRDAKYPFTKMYFIDSNADYCEALRERLNYVFSFPDYAEPETIEIIEGDVNEEIGWIVDEIQDIGSYDRRYNYYCFIDNQGLDVEWSTLQQLTPTPYGDLLINLPIAHAIGRNIDTEAAARFYGAPLTEILPGRPSRAELRDRYLDQLASRNRAIQSSTTVQTNIGSFYYDLVYATRPTGGNNGYMDVIDYVKQFIESVHSGDIDRILDVLDTNQSVIDIHLPEGSIKDQLPEDEDDAQTALDEFG